MKKTFSLLTVLCLGAAFSPLAITQTEVQTMYVAEKSGLSLREKPDAASKRILSVPYGAQLQASDSGSAGEAEGLQDRWYKTKYNGKEGYLLGVYLTGLPVPKDSCSSFMGYFTQITGAKDENSRRDILTNKFSIELSEGGKTCESGYRASFFNWQMKDVFLLSRLIYGRDFSALKKKYSSIAKFDPKSGTVIHMSRKTPRTVIEISLLTGGDSIGFQETVKKVPCAP